jgi:hypothetical protein
MNGNHVIIERVVDGKRESLGQQAMVPAKTQAMNAGIEMQRINVGKQRVEEIGTQAWTLFLVKPTALLQIPLGFIKDANPHEEGRESLALAVSQSENVACPDAARSARS